MTWSTSIHAYLRTDINFISEGVCGGRGMVVGIRDEGENKLKNKKQTYE